MKQIFFKHSFILYFFFLCTGNIHAQKDLPFYRHNLNVGRNLLTHENIPGARSFMGCDIFNVYPDTINKFILFELRFKPNNEDRFLNSGYLTRYNYIDKKVIWTNKINKTSVLFKDDILSTNSSNNSTCVDINTGKKVWDKEFSIISISPDNKYILTSSCKKPALNQQDSIYAINSADGKRLWSFVMPSVNLISDIQFYKDSTLILTANGIHKIDQNNKRMWSYHANMIKKRKYIDNSIFFIAAMGGGIVGAMLASAILTTSYNMLVSSNNKHQFRFYNSICSNVINDSDYYYFASSDSLYCIDKKGKLDWRNNLPEKSTSTSLLYESENYLVLVNTGIAYAGIKTETVGLPYIAVFNMHNGNNLILNHIKIDSTIIDFKHSNDTITLLTNNKIITYKILNNIPLFADSISSKTYGNILGFVNQPIFQISNDSTKILNFSNEKHVFLTNKGNYYSCISGGHPELIGNENNVYYKLENYRNLQFYKAKNQIIICNSNNLPLASIRCGKNNFIMDHVLYTTYDTYLQEIFLNNFYNK